MEKEECVWDAINILDHIFWKWNIFVMQYF